MCHHLMGCRQARNHRCLGLLWGVPGGKNGQWGGCLGIGTGIGIGIGRREIFAGIGACLAESGSGGGSGSSEW
jgi:hypothetical protein